jgi:endoglucanase
MGDGFVGVNGTAFEAGGRPVVFRGFGLGNWLNLEHFMIGLPGTDSQIRAAIRAAYGPERAAEFWERYCTCYVADADFAFMKGIGVNAVRIPFNYRLFEDDQSPGEYDEGGFRHLDRALELCARHGIYAFLDLHSAPGGQNPDWHADNAVGECLFWEHRGFRDRTVGLWRHIAERYRDNRWVAGYDLLNEPATYARDDRRADAFFRRLAAAVREVDPNHVVVIEGDFYAHHFGDFSVPEDPNVAYSFHHYPFFSADEFTGPDAAAKLDASLMEEGFVRDVLDRLGRPAWCGETGVPADPVRQEVYEKLNADTLDAYERHGLSWSVWCYKDARGMGAVRPTADSPWMEFSRRARGQWDFWDEFMPAVAAMDAEGPGEELPAALRRKLTFRRLADSQLVLCARYPSLLASTPFDEFVELPESFLFERCEQWTGIIDAVKKHTGC